MSQHAQFSKTPEPPYYVVIFASQRTDGDHGYQQMAKVMAELVAGQPGYLGHDSVRDASGFGMTVAYWRDEESVRNWRNVAEHLAAQRLGKEQWYSHYEVRVAKVERAYSGPEGRGPAGAVAADVG